MLPTRGEGEPAKPQEGQEFNRQKSNSKARTGSPDERTKPEGVGEDRAPHHPASEKHAADPRPTGDGGGRDREEHQGPVPGLDAIKVDRSGHFRRTGEAR